MVQPRTVITYGTFDLLHIGHINLLRRAREMGDYLIVGLSTDRFNILKHKESPISFEDRRMILESLRFVDLVIPEDTWEQKEHDIKKYNVHTFVMGDDWAGNFDSLNSLCEVHYIPRTKDISSAKLRNRLKI